jgi:hypothetical protein
LMIGLAQSGDSIARECSGRFGGTVSTLNSLVSVPAYARAHGMVCAVLDTKQLWIFDSLSAASADDDVVVPSDGRGRWLATTQLALARWDDLAPNRASVGSAAAAPTVQAYRDTPMQYEFLRHDQDDTFYFQWQMSHRWVVGTDVNPHIHVVPCGNVTGNALPANAGWTQFASTHTVNGSDQYLELPMSMAGHITPPAWADHSAHLHVVVRRAGNDPLDTYTASNPSGTAQANLALISVDCHVLNYPDGTIFEFPGA